MHATMLGRVPARSEVQDVAILDLLVWAFQRECAQLDFDRHGVSAAGWGYVSSTAAIIQHEQLGCRVDGGGRSDPHPDADVVASAVASLPEARGGRGMAIRIAEHALTGTVPDWGCGLGGPKCVPLEWKRSKHGVFAQREYWKGPGRWPANLLGRDHGYVCPVHITGSAAEHAMRRRAYLDWWGALLDLRMTFQVYPNLSCWVVSDDMPPRAPWKSVGNGLD
ncbi:hypothetical protein [Thalassovita sp.]|uniref:hypothetical protein n=1 Tax=Thalassovita sp. TaxID=1979401 RepID=UPI0028815995|nr:hypothetical protein [Thalassovita sp.]MDF1801714.1 hypothetical protein [Thalassovita sp.]